MKQAAQKFHKLNSELRNIRKKIFELSENLKEEYSTVNEQLEDIETTLYDVKAIIEDKLVMQVPTSPVEALDVLDGRYQLSGGKARQAYEAIMSAWSRATELRGLLRRTSKQSRNRFIGALETNAADDYWRSPDDPPLVPDEELAVEAIKLEWSRAVELRDLVSRADWCVRRRFIAVVCVESSLSSCLPAGF